MFFQIFSQEKIGQKYYNKDGILKIENDIYNAFQRSLKTGIHQWRDKLLRTANAFRL